MTRTRAINVTNVAQGGDAPRRRGRGRRGRRVAQGARDGHPEPHSGGRALPDQRGAGRSRRPTRSTGRRRTTPASRQLPPEDLRRVERLDDVELVARSGLARRLPAARARRVDATASATRPTPPDGTPKAHAQPVRAAGTVRVGVRHRRPASSRCRGRARCWTRSARAVTCRPTTSTTCRCAT